MIDNDKFIVLAMLIQNALHPKNHQRREAVTGKTYIEIKNRDSANSFLHNLVKYNLKNEVLGKETALI